MLPLTSVILTIKNIQVNWKMIIGLTLGISIPLILLAGYLARHHILASYWEIAYIYNFLYSNNTLTQRITSEVEWIKILSSDSPVFVITLFTWLGGIVYLGWKVAKRQEWFNPPLLFGLSAFPIEMILLNTSGNIFRHYGMPLIPVQAILCGWLLNQVVSYKKIPKLISNFCLLLFLIISSTLPLTNLIENAKKDRELYLSQTSLFEVIRYIKQNTKPGDYLLVWGSTTLVNFLTDLPAPTRFGFQVPLFRHGYTSEKLITEFLDDLQKRPPVMIVNTHHPLTPFVYTDTSQTCKWQDTLPEDMNEVYQYICANYTQIDVITKDQWEIYRITPR